MKLYIISNRLPAKACKEKNGTFIFSRSEGGLATGLNSLKTTDEKHWIGWPGTCVDKKEDEQIISEQLEKLNFHPSFYHAINIKITMKDIVIVQFGPYVTIFSHIQNIKTVFGKLIKK